MTSKLTREQITSWMNDANYALEEPLNADDAAAARAILAMGHELLAAMDQRPALHRYRRKAVEPYGPYPWHYEVFVDYPRPVEGIEDEFFYAAPVVPLGYVMVPACLLSELRDWAHPEIEDYCDMWAGRRDDEFPALRKIIADADALLAAADCSIPMISDRWISVSDQMPEIGDIVLTSMGGVVNVGETECSAANCLFFTSVISGRELPATHWMPLPTAPQGDK
ncbi:DUF551 domain-containing protein [Klebsiella variicola]|uniref:DUF551 domain-containing protein n=1 Tax=Klebsiella variicola TaxID=244366 RepID=UPI001F441686|nr:DUF551 domain-containing protein [Klebsiella variicola]